MLKRLILISLTGLFLVGCALPEDTEKQDDKTDDKSATLTESLIEVVNIVMTLPEGSVTYNLLDYIEGLEDVQFTGLINSSEGYETVVLHHDSRDIFINGSKGSEITLQGKTYKVHSTDTTDNTIIIYEQKPKDESKEVVETEESN